jgi:1-aminocyclopropane-1-carboxylate deaminase/D-cysteine desulfhydrase-like pyridoxal-dependent ACC family enzyme
MDGNLLLDSLFGAEIRVFEAGDIDNMLELASVSHVIDPIVRELETEGMTPYLAPIGGSLVEGAMQGPWGALGYVEAIAEIAEQADDLGTRFDSIVLATGSAGTQAGLVAGARFMSLDVRVVGISVYGSGPTVAGYVRSIGDRVLAQLGSHDTLRDEEIVVLDDYIGEGYGVFNDAVGAAIHSLARSEGLLLDPVYTGKAMAGMVDLIDQGYFGEQENILFLHTGGTPALFPYREQVTAGLQLSDVQ